MATDKGTALAVVRGQEQELASLGVDYSVSERVLAMGDLAQLTSQQRVQYYTALCHSLGLNPLSRPFDYVALNGKLQLYAKKDCTDQLRSRQRVSIVSVKREFADGVLITTVRARTPDGREDEDVGVVPFDNARGEARANAVMKSLTKAKRRVTLSICGLGFTDESELEGVRNAKHVTVDHETGEILESKAPETTPAEREALVREALDIIAAADSLERLKVIGAEIRAKKLDEETRMRLSEAWMARKTELSKPKSEPPPAREPGDDSEEDAS